MLKLLPLETVHHEYEVGGSGHPCHQLTRTVGPYIEASFAHQAHGDWIGSVTDQRRNAGGLHRYRLDTPREKGFCHRTAADVSRADNQHALYHFAITPAVKPVLINGINKLNTRLKRTRPLPSTYTTSLGCNSKSLASSIATGDLPSR